MGRIVSVGLGCRIAKRSRRFAIETAARGMLGEEGIAALPMDCCPERAVLATTTSALSVTRSVKSRADRSDCRMHFFNQWNKMTWPKRRARSGTSEENNPPCPEEQIVGLRHS